MNVVDLVNLIAFGATVDEHLKTGSVNESLHAQMQNHIIKIEKRKNKEQESDTSSPKNHFPDDNME